MKAVNLPTILKITVCLLISVSIYSQALSQDAIDETQLEEAEEIEKEGLDYDIDDPESQIAPHKFGVNETPMIDEGFFPGVTNEELELTEPQIEKLKKIKTASKEKKTALFKELETPEGELNQLLKLKNPNLRRVDAKISRMGKIQAEIHRIDVHELIQSRKVLSIKQWKKVKKAEKQQLEE